jgi:catechol 2,3-dioxygenase-like lactoylglutathione lyase family enzyme
VGFEVDGIHHLTLNVADLERSKAFYSGVLGFVPDQDFPGEKLRYRIGPYTRLVLVPPVPGTPEGDRFSEARIGLDHVSLGVRSPAVLERLVDTLRAAGVETRGIQSDALGPSLVCFRDPDNIAWEFFEQP